MLTAEVSAAKGRGALQVPGKPGGTRQSARWCCSAALPSKSHHSDSKTWRRPRCPSVEEWIKQPWDVYTTECYLALKKNGTLPSVTARMHPEGVMLSETRLSEEDEFHVVPVTRGT